MTEPITERMKAYWEQVHKRGDLGEIRAALTGAHLADHVDALKVMDLVRRDSSILCIGVGLGGWIWELAHLGCQVSALDIAPSALERVKDFAKGYLPSDPLPKGQFDLAMSHWVTPHMPPAALVEQMKNVVPSLKPSGVFAMQFSEPLGWVDGVDPRTARTEDRRMRSAGSLYYRRDIEELVGLSGGKVLSYPQEYQAPTYFMSIVMVHIVRK